jgi:hypothetical protein
MHFSWEVNLGNLITGIPMLLIMVKMYGDWRIIKMRINLMWAAYCKEHHISVEME